MIPHEKEMKEYLDRETKAQKDREYTPRAISLNLIVTVLMGPLMLLMISWWHDDDNKKFESLFKTQQCLTKSVYACCGSKANVGC